MLKQITKKQYQDLIKTATPSLDFNAIHKHNVTYVSKSKKGELYHIYLKGLFDGRYYSLSLSEQYIKLIEQNKGNLGFEMLEYFLEYDGKLTDHKSGARGSEFIELTMKKGVCPQFNHSGEFRFKEDDRKKLVKLRDNSLFGQSDRYSVFLKTDRSLVIFDKNDISVSFATILETFGFKEDYLQQLSALYMPYDEVMRDLIELERTVVYYTEFELTIINKNLLIGALESDTVYFHDKLITDNVKAEVEQVAINDASKFSIKKFNIKQGNDADYINGRLFMMIYSAFTREYLFSIQYDVPFARGPESKMAGNADVIGLADRRIVQGLPKVGVPVTN